MPFTAGLHEQTITLTTFSKPKMYFIFTFDPKGSIQGSMLQMKWKAMQDAAEMGGELAEFTNRMHHWEFKQASPTEQKNELQCSSQEPSTVSMTSVPLHPASEVILLCRDLIRRRF